MRWKRLWTQVVSSFGLYLSPDNLMRTVRRKVRMSDLITRLRQRAHLSEFRICGEAAEALEAARRELEEANHRYHEVCAAWLTEQQTRQTTHSKRERARGSSRSHLRSAPLGGPPEP